MTSFLKHFTVYENVHKMKNKPDPTILKTLFISNKISKTTPKFHETIPLNLCFGPGSGRLGLDQDSGMDPDPNLT
jgi:hypothetical protein